MRTTSQSTCLHETLATVAIIKIDPLERLLICNATSKNHKAYFIYNTPGIETRPPALSPKTNNASLSDSHSSPTHVPPASYSSPRLPGPSHTPWYHPHPSQNPEEKFYTSFSFYYQIYSLSHPHLISRSTHIHPYSLFFTIKL